MISSIIQVLYSILRVYKYTQNIIRHNIRTSMNERTNTLLYKDICLTLYSRKGDAYCV